MIAIHPFQNDPSGYFGFPDTHNYSDFQPFPDRGTNTLLYGPPSARPGADEKNLAPNKGAKFGGKPYKNENMKIGVNLLLNNLLGWQDKPLFSNVLQSTCEQKGSVTIAAHGNQYLHYGDSALGVSGWQGNLMEQDFGGKVCSQVSNLYLDVCEMKTTTVENSWKPLFPNANIRFCQGTVIAPHGICTSGWEWR